VLPTIRVTKTSKTWWRRIPPMTTAIHRLFCSFCFLPWTVCYPFCTPICIAVVAFPAINVAQFALHTRNVGLFSPEAWAGCLQGLVFRYLHCGRLCILRLVVTT
jgi:hypothetical protein